MFAINCVVLGKLFTFYLVTCPEAIRPEVGAIDEM